MPLSQGVLQEFAGAYASGSGTLEVVDKVGLIHKLLKRKRHSLKAELQRSTVRPIVVGASVRKPALSAHVRSSRLPPAPFDSEYRICTDAPLHVVVTSPQVNLSANPPSKMATARSMELRELPARIFPCVPTFPSPADSPHNPPSVARPAEPGECAGHAR